ncbi:MerR family transcriptional regulator [Pelagibacteraceae bacterium]|nr:MerR family transcriptional regulator [Pelagibacteraceae bacterium]
MILKKYLNISEVSKMLQIEEHKIRYWDSIDPKTKKYRIDGISTKSKGGTRYFNKDNIKKLQKLKKILYDGDKHNHTIKLAEKILSSNNLSSNQKNQINFTNLDNLKKIEQILNKMRILLKNNNLK